MNPSQMTSAVGRSAAAAAEGEATAADRPAICRRCRWAREARDVWGRPVILCESGYIAYECLASEAGVPGAGRPR